MCVTHLSSRQINLLTAECNISGRYTKRANAGNKKTKLLLDCVDELPDLSSAGSPPIEVVLNFSGLLAEVAHKGVSGLIR
jgi:hypothetical protein